MGLSAVVNAFEDSSLPACLAVVNIFVAVLVRNELFLNALYRILVTACRTSHVPVATRNGVTSVLLNLGGIHSGCAVFSIVWLTVGVFNQLSNGSLDTRWLTLIGGTILLSLTTVCVMSLPRIRDRYHNLFEFTHRFLGWSTLLLLWGYAVLLVKWSSDGAEAGVGVLTTQNVVLYLTVAMTALIASPWLTVRKVRVQARVPSQSIVELTFPGGSQPGMFGRISRRLLGDWHAFAVVSR